VDASAEVIDVGEPGAGHREGDADQLVGCVAHDRNLAGRLSLSIKDDAPFRGTITVNH